MKLETKLKHTPAPWKWGNALDERQRNGSPWPMLQSDDPDAGWIAMSACDPWEPDARLIAAAPDLLDALMKATILLKHAHDDASALESQYAVETAAEMTAALTKAIGETQE